MANKPSKEKKLELEAVAPVTITYDLIDLPTAQHKAGLAGLLLQIDSMLSRKKAPPTYEWDQKQPNTKVHVTFTEETVQALFDDAYDAEVVEAKVKSKWPGALESRPSEESQEIVDGKPKKVRHFFYNVTQPIGPFLKHYIRNAPEQWLRLWRNMLWAIPRGNPQSRLPFEQRAATPKQPCKEGSNAWLDLIKAEKARSLNGFHTDAVAGTLWLGAQAANAENVPFEGRVEQTLLLHFWPLTTQVYAPQMVQPDGSSEFVGYVLAIPEVADLPRFMEEYPKLLAQLGDARRGYRPAEAVIDLPAEGALSFLTHLDRLAEDKATGTKLQFSIGSVEFFHLAKFGNNIKTLATNRIAPRQGLLRRYMRIVGRPGETPPYGNVLFRQGLMLALLNDQPWFEPFGKMFAEWAHKFFLPSDDPPKLSWFWADARNKLKEVYQSMPTEPEPDPANSPDVDDVLATTINKFVKHFLDKWFAKEKPEWDFKKFRKAKKTPPEAAEARRKLAERLFLEFRSRRHQSFIDYFSANFFRVGQYFGHDFEMIAKKLFEETDKVKTLTLMALSANSWIPTPKKETDE